MWILTLENGGDKQTAAAISERAGLCMACGHCMAVCPSDSVSVSGLSYGRQIFETSASEMDGEAFMKLMESRRSCRVFKERPVPRETLENIVDAVTFAPMGFTPHKIEITIVSGREKIEKALPVVIEMYEKLAKIIKNPIARFFMRRQIAPEDFNSLTGHVLPSLKYRLPDMKAGKGDTITRGAPAMLLFHADKNSSNHTCDANIALTYGLLAAHALGLGATAISLVPPIVNRSPELRKMFQIPEQNEVTASMIVGYPKFKIRKNIRRELAGVTWV